MSQEIYRSRALRHMERASDDFGEIRMTGVRGILLALKNVIVYGSPYLAQLRGAVEEFCQAVEEEEEGLA